MEAAVVLDRNWKALYYHAPAGRTAVQVPDTHKLWEVLHENRARLLGVAHSHPWHGEPAPSMTDLTTFAALEADLGMRLTWPIVTLDSVNAYVWKGPGRLEYRERVLPNLMGAPWVIELLKLSEVKE